MTIAPVTCSLRLRQTAVMLSSSCRPTRYSGKRAIRRRMTNPQDRERINGNRKLHMLGRDMSGGGDVVPLMPTGRIGLDAGSGSTGVQPNTRREAAGPSVTVKILAEEGELYILVRSAQWRLKERGMRRRQLPA